MVKTDLKLSEKNKPKSPLNQFIRFTSLGFEMMAMILICSLVGNFIDGKAETSRPYYTLLLMLFGVFASMYRLFKSLNQNDNR